MLNWKADEELVDKQDYKPNKRLLAQADLLKHNALGYETDDNVIPMQEFKYMNETEKEVALKKKRAEINKKMKEE